MVDNVQKGGVPGGDAVSTRGEGKVENKNIFKKTAQRIGALALICATSMSILVGCGDKEDNAPKETPTEAAQPEDANKPAEVKQEEQRQTIYDKLGEYQDREFNDESSESNYDDQDNYDYENAMDSNEVKDKVCIGVTNNGIKFDLTLTRDRTQKTLENHPGYKILPFGGDFSEFAKNNDADGFKDALLSVMDDQPHVLATNAAFLLSEQEKLDLGFGKGIDEPHEMYDQLLTVQDGGEFQKAVLDKVAEILDDSKISFGKFDGNCDSYGVMFDNKDGDVVPDNISIGKVHHTGDSFIIAKVLREDGTSIYIKLNCGAQPIGTYGKVTPTPIVTEKVTPTPTTIEKVTPTPTNTPTPTDKITSTPTPTEKVTPTPTNTPTPTEIVTPTPTNTPTPTEIVTPTPTNTPTPTEIVTPTPTNTPTPTLKPKDPEHRQEVDKGIQEGIKEEYGLGGEVTIDPEGSDADKEDPTKKPDGSKYDGTTFTPTQPPEWQATPTPTQAPTEAPTQAPTPAPTEAPTQAPDPTKEPTPAPTAIPVTPTGDNDFSQSLPPSSTPEPTKAPAATEAPASPAPTKIPDNYDAQKKANEEQGGANDGEGIKTSPDELTDDDLEGFNF